MQPLELDSQLSQGRRVRPHQEEPQELELQDQDSLPVELQLDLQIVQRIKMILKVVREHLAFAELPQVKTTSSSGEVDKPQDLEILNSEELGQEAPPLTRTRILNLERRIEEAQKIKCLLASAKALK